MAEGVVVRPDPDGPDRWLLEVDGTPMSHVDLADPTHLAFEYVRRLGHVLDAAAPSGAPLRVLHLGGGALTLARYVAVTRPGSVQRVVELDPEVAALSRDRLPLPRGARVRVRVDDARSVLAGRPDASFDVVLGDVFSGARVPAAFTTRSYAADLRRVVRPGGLYAANLADGPPLDFVRRQVATVGAAFEQVALVAEPAVLKGRRFGNLVLVAAAAPVLAAVAPRLTRACAADPYPSRVLDGPALARFSAGAVPVGDEEAAPSPAPPRGWLGGYGGRS